jgi:hypothetical protein
MEVVFDLSVKSINEAIKEIKKVSKDVKTANMELICQRIIELANLRLDVLTDLDQSIKDGIKQGWQIPAISGDMATITNSNNKAVYIEFGVGAVAEATPHPDADFAKYRYDVDSRYKQSDRSWQFKVKGEDPVDLRSKNYTLKPMSRGQTLVVTTRGNEPGLFLYNAVLDFVEELEA